MDTAKKNLDQVVSEATKIGLFSINLAEAPEEGRKPVRMHSTTKIRKRLKESGPWDIDIEKLKRRRKIIVSRINWLDQSNYETGEAFNHRSNIGLYSATLTYRACSKAKTEKRLGGINNIDNLLDSIAKNHNYIYSKFVAVADYGDDGDNPHIHCVFMVRNEEDYKKYKLFIDSWDNAHGMVHTDKILSERDLCLYIQYMLKDRKWMELGTKKGALFRSGSVCMMAGVSRIKGMDILVRYKDDDDGDDPNKGGRKIPEWVEDQEGTRDVLNYGSGHSRASIQSQAFVDDIESAKIRGKMACYEKVIASLIKTYGRMSRVFINRIIKPFVVSTYKRIWLIGGARRAIKYIINRLSSVHKKWVWKDIQEIRDMGYIVDGILIQSTSGTTRLHTDLDSMMVWDILAIPPEEIRAKIRNAA